MKPILLASALALAWQLPALEAAGPAGTKQAEAVQTYIVRFDGLPLASRLAELERRKRATGVDPLPIRRLDLHAAEAGGLRADIEDEQMAVLDVASQRLGRPLQPLWTYRNALNAVSLSLTAAEASAIAALPGVASVRAETTRRMLTDAGPQWIGADAIWTGQAATATRGEGVVVGVIDSGVNRTHGSFASVAPVGGYAHSNPRGRRYGLCASGPSCGDKLIGVYDFTVCTGVHASTECNDRELNDGTDPDGHGSHVAATAVGNPHTASITLPGGASSRALSGVAPRANLIAYKACEEEEDCRLTWLLAAIDQAVDDGVDVINYSIGSTEPENPWESDDAIAFQAAREAGIVVVVAAGNDGPAPSSISAPSHAPWVLAVANATHDRAIVNRLTGLSGGSSAPPGGGVLVGDGFTAGLGARRMVVPQDFPLCSTGSNLDSPPSGISNPWQPGRFNGEIVICLRGTQARVAKSNNVRLAGGAGMVLVNQAADGELTIADEHSIPSTHLGATDGAALLAWLGGGSGHMGSLEGAQVRNEASRADLLNASSGRGPVAVSEFLKPDLTAPGTNVLAAAGTGTGFAFLTGTSMASPHVAGAAALLFAAKPEWTADDVETALRTTTANSIRLGIQSPAGAFDQGSGRVELGDAVRSGLRFALSGAELRAADPALNGDGSTLNLPSVVSMDCFERCSFQRRITDIRGGGRWRVEVLGAGALGVQVTPGEFSLANLATQTLAIEVDTSDPAVLGRQAEARIRLLPLNAQGQPVSDVAVAELPVSVFASAGNVPVRISLENAAADRGYRDINFFGLAALEQLRFGVTNWVAPVVTERVLAVDPTNDDAYDNLQNGVFFTTVEVPAGVSVRDFRLLVDSSSSSSRDVDLFVGEDFDGDGGPDSNEELCRSATSTAVESCVLSVSSTASTRRFWILAQNWAAGLSAQDSVRVETKLVDLAAVTDGALRATGPARSARLEGFPVRLIWNDPEVTAGARRFAFMHVQAGGADEPFATIAIDYSRAAGANAAEVLSPGVTRSMRLAPGASSEHLIVDVPPNASKIRLQSAGSGEVDLYLAAVGAASSVVIPSAPAREQAVASARNPGANEMLEFPASTAGLNPGRFYVTPVNTGSSEAAFNLQVSVETNAVLSAPRFGAYFNPARDGAGAFLFGDPASWGLLWYTYLQDGTPTWYVASGAPPAASAGNWSADLFRASWNGSAADLTAVGNVVLTKRDVNGFQFGWNIDGQSGSESYVYIDGGGCPQVNGGRLDVNGLWYDPNQPGYGYSVLAFSAIESNGAYFFDDRGVGRWALGSIPTSEWSSPFGADQLPFDVRLGSCPGCAYVTPTVIANRGVLERNYVSSGADSGRRGNMQFDIQLPSPMSGRWVVNAPVVKLTAPVGCP